MRQTRLSIFLISLIVVVSCGENDKVYRIAGERYSVPEEYSVPDIPYIPENPLYPDSGGFAFGGCEKRPDGGTDNCPFKYEVSGGTFGDAATVGNWNVEEWPWNSQYTKVLRDPGSKVEVATNGMVVVTNDGLLRWLVMIVDDNDALEPGVQPVYDELIAVCEYTRDFRERPYISCSRHAIRGNLGPTYHFEARDRAPNNIAEIDENLFSVMRSWRSVGE